MLKEFWKIVRYGVPVVKNRIEANRYWELFFKLGVGAISLAVLGGLFGVIISHYVWAGPEVGRTIIFFSGFLSSLIFMSGILFEDFVLSVLVAAFPNELVGHLEDIRSRLNKTLWLWLSWILFLETVFFVVGIYAPKFAIMLGLLGLLLILSIGPDNERFIKIARFVCYSSFIYCVLCAIPSHVWVFAAGRDFAPILRLESALGEENAVRMKDLERARLERKKELCSQRIIEETKKVSEASLKSLKDLEKSQKNMEIDCGSPPSP